MNRYGEGPGGQQPLHSSRCGTPIRVRAEYRRTDYRGSDRQWSRFGREILTRRIIKTLSNKRFYFFVKWFFNIPSRCTTGVNPWLSPYRAGITSSLQSRSNLTPRSWKQFPPEGSAFQPRAELFEPFIFEHGPWLWAPLQC